MDLRFRKASGKMIRVMLQQGEKAGLVEKVDKRQFGRRLTLKGRQLLDSIKVASPQKMEFKMEAPKNKIEESEAQAE